MMCVFESLENRQLLSFTPGLAPAARPLDSAALLVPLATSLTNVVGSYKGSINVSGVHAQQVKVTITSQSSTGVIAGKLTSVADPSVVTSLSGQVLANNNISMTLTGGGGHAAGGISGSGSGKIVVTPTQVTLTINLNFTQPFTATGTLTLAMPQQVLTSIVVAPAANQIATAGQTKSFSLGSFTQTNATGPYSVDVNWGDGSADTKFSMAAAGTITAQAHKFTKAVTDAVRVSITDSKGHASNKPTFNVAVSAAAAAKLVITRQPATAIAGKAINPAVTVAIEDAFGNVVTTNSSTVTITRNTGPTGSTISGTLAVAAIKGIATFSNLVLKTAGQYKLKASFGLLTAAISSAFTVSPAAASKLVFIAQPPKAKVGQLISPAVKVAIEDAFGNIVTMNKSTVKLSIFSGPAGGVLTGTLSIADLAGVATFSTLKLGKAGTYKLKAVDGLLLTATSNSFAAT